MAMKKRLSDYMSVPRETSAPLYRTQKISFKMFQQKEAIHMKALYPFLTKTQINSKVRELWKNMSDTEKEGFSKVVLTKTPTKSPNVGKVAKTSRNRSAYGSKTKCSIWKDFENESKSKTYHSDFTSPEVSVEKTKSSPSWLIESPSIPVTKDYSKSRVPSEVVPEVIDMTPSKQPGILKQTSTNDIQLDESPIRKRSRVSFSPQRTEEEQTECTSKNNNSPPENSPGYSSEEDETLIRRDYNDACNFDDIEKFSMCIETDDSLVCQSNLNKKTDFVEGPENNVKQNKKDIKENEMEPNIDINAVKTEKSKTRTLKRKKSSGNEKPSVNPTPSKITENIVKKVTTPDLTAKRITRSTPLIMKSNIDQYTTPLLTKSNIDKYTTPLMDDATMNQLTEQAKQAPKKRQSRGGDKAKILEEVDNRPAEVNKRHHVRTSLISVKSEELQGESMIDASGDAKIGVGIEKIQDSKSVTDQGLDDNNNIESEEEEEDILMPPIHSTLGSYFKIPDKPHDIELSESESSVDELFEACKTTSNSSVLETLKRMKEVVWKPSTPANSPVSSPKILSPALSGISQLSSASSESKCSLSGAETQKQEDLDDKIEEKTQHTKEKTKHRKDNSHKDCQISQNQATSKYIIGNTNSSCKKPEIKNVMTSKAEDESIEISVKNENLTNMLRKTDEANDEIFSNSSLIENLENGDNNICTIKPQDVKKPKITRFAKRKAPSALQELANGSDKALCELFYDLTPPEGKHKKTTNRRVLASAVTPGKSNFNLLFDNKTIF